MGEETNSTYLLSWVIEPLAQMLESLLDWDHAKAVMWVKLLVYGSLTALIAYLVYSGYHWLKAEE